MINSVDYISLKEICSKISVGFVGTTSPYFCEPSDGVPLLRSKNIKPGKIDLTDLAYVTFDFHKKNKKSRLQKGDIVIVRVGQNRGDVCKIGSEFPEVNVANCVFLRPPEEYSDYIEILLRSNYGRKLLLSVTTGSAQEVLNTSAIAELEIPLPTIDFVHYLSKTINSFDQKITLLREQNQTLEELAQTLFKRWFVEFEFPNENGQPYKSSGGKMVESELGEIPEGWRVSYLNSFISDSIGGDYGKEEPVGDFTEETTCLRGTDLPDMKTGLPERAPVRFIKPSKLKKCKLNTGDIVIEISGGTEGQSTGRAMYINEQVLSHYSRPMTCVNFCRILRPKTIESSYYSYLLLDFLYTRGVFFNLENGSTGIKNLDLKTLLNDYELPIPNIDLVQKFDSSIKGIFKKVQENNKEIQSLTQLRDTLLPKLMSGELRVTE